MVTQMVTTREGIHELEAGATAEIGYMNAQGTVTTRRIDILRDYQGRNGERYLRAYCHLRCEERTFRVDRVVAVYEVHRAHPSAERITHLVEGICANDNGTVNCSVPNSTPGNAGVGSTEVSPPSGLGRSPFNKLRNTLLVLTGIGIAVFCLAQTRPDPVPSPETTVDYGQGRTAGAASSAGAAASQPGPEPPDTIWYRGRRIVRQAERGGAQYLVADSGLTFGTLHEARVSINTRALRKLLGMRNPDLYRRYAEADRNRDGNLDWEEIRRFQNNLYREFRYLTNTIALRPDAFLRNGGGDCEDWALVAAGLLQFWQVPVYIASITSDSGRHAVALVQTPHPPSGALYFTFDGRWGLPDSSYVPIDYNTVGGLSNAVAGEYFIDAVWRPEEIYDRAL